jgi:hypothetical protein
MLLVILGAGASYDSAGPEAPADDGRPPLAVQLFERRGAFDNAVTHFPECRPVLAQLRAAAVTGSGAVESALRELQAQEDAYPERYLSLSVLARSRWHVGADPKCSRR